MLAYIQISTPDGKVEFVDLNDVIAKVKENLKTLIEEADAVVVSPRLPVLQAYTGHMVSLFQNLITTSIKYRSQQPPGIQVGANESDHMHEFSVIDNGIGISPEYHAKIFLAFKRLHGNDIPGTGNGLAICRRVVERYGGRIWVKSEAGLAQHSDFTLPKQAGTVQNQ